MNARVGDVVDDYCTRCHLLTNHSVASLADGAVAHTTCRTCGFEHKYRGGKVPASRARSKPSAFDQVLAGILGERPPDPPSRKRR